MSKYKSGEAAGDVAARQVARAPEGAGVTDARVLYRVTLFPATKLRPRETATLAVEVANVGQTSAVFAAQVGEAKGRQLDARSERDRNGRVTAHLAYEVPLAAAGSLVDLLFVLDWCEVAQRTVEPLWWL